MLEKEFMHPAVLPVLYYRLSTSRIFVISIQVAGKYIDSDYSDKINFFKMHLLLFVVTSHNIWIFKLPDMIMKWTHVGQGHL